MPPSSKSSEDRSRIVLAGDVINEPLKRMTKYLSRLMQGTTEILSAQTYGQQLAEAKAAAPRPGRTL